MLSRPQLFNSISVPCWVLMVPTTVCCTGTEYQPVPSVPMLSVRWSWWLVVGCWYQTCQ